VPARRWVKPVTLTARCILNCWQNKQAADPHLLSWFRVGTKKQKALIPYGTRQSPAASSTCGLGLLNLCGGRILGVLPGELAMRALHRQGRMSGQIYDISTALSLATAAARVRGASDT